MIDRAIVEFAKNLEMTSKAFRMYSESHPRTQAILQASYDLLRGILATRPHVTLSVVHENIVCDGEIVERGSPILNRLARELSERNIDTLKFLQDTTMDNLIFLFRQLQLSPQRLREAGGIEKIFDERSISTVLINKVKYGIIDDQPANVDQAMLTELLLVVQTLLSERSDVAEVAANVEKSLETSGTVDPGAILLRLFQTIASSAPQPAPGLETEPIRQKFAELYHSFTPAVQAKLLVASILSDPPEKDGTAFYKDLSPEEIEKSILAVLDQPLPEDQLRAFVERLKAKEDIALSDHILKQLQKHFPDEMKEHPEPHGLELIRKDSWSADDIRTVPDSLKQLIAGNYLSEADLVSKRIFHLLGAAPADQKKAAIEALPSLISVLSQHEKWKNVELSLSLLISTCYKKESSEEVVHAYIPCLLSMFLKNYEAKKWQSCQDLLSTIRTQFERFPSLRMEFADAWIVLAEHFIEHLREGWEGSEVVFNGLRLAGARGVSFLADLLADEEDQKVRSRLVNAIVEFPHDIILSEAHHRMSDSRWFVVRNMVTILAKLDLVELPDFLNEAAKHPDTRVAKEVIKLLLKSTSKSNLRLALLLMQHPDKNVRIQAVHLVTMQSNAAAVPALVNLLESPAPGETDVRTACLQALLKFRSLEGLVPAATLLDRKPSSKTEVAERNAAVRLLGELAREQMRAVLEKTAQTDPYPETRSVASSYLSS